MLTTLRIRNLALVEDLTLEFRPGFNAISGETGAGKSILIGALNLVLGERASRDMIRGGCESCSVEAVFDVSRLEGEIRPVLEASGVEWLEAGELILKRTFSSAGANRQFANGSPTTLATLAAIGEWLVDVHGPHEHQSLLNPAKQLSILDAFAGLAALRREFETALGLRLELQKAKAALITDEKTLAQQLELLRFQTQEISSARLDPTEEAPLEEEFRRASNVTKLAELAHAAHGVIAGEEGSCRTQLGQLGRLLGELRAIDPATTPLSAMHSQVRSALEELLSELTRYLDRLDLDPERLVQLEERLNVIQGLKRKYGPKLSDVVAFGESAERQLQDLLHREVTLTRMRAEEQQLEKQLIELGHRLTQARTKVIPALCRLISAQLDGLSFQQSRFEIGIRTDASVDLNSDRARASGFDAVEFHFAPNRGEPCRPLRAIASSGELARVMLGLKTVLAAEDRIPVLVFDEVDANVGGETARAVGERMRQIAGHHQVLCITHLAQVAAAAATHFVVSKKLEGDRTRTEVQLLNPAERKQELARMLGGQSAAALQHASVILEESTAHPGGGKAEGGRRTSPRKGARSAKL